MSKKKDSLAESYRQAAGTYADTIRQQGAADAQAVKDAAAAANSSAAEVEAERAANAAQTNKSISDLLAANYSANEAILAAAKNRTQEAEAENAEQTEADRRTGTYTGMAELGTSLANLLAVGGNGATSQVYRNYSQDWMQKADRNIRERRARIDNLRERQRGLQNALNTLRMNNGLTMLRNEADERARALEARNKAAERTNAAAAQAAGITSKAGAEAAGAEYKGAAAGLQAQTQQEQFNARLGQNAAQFEATMRTKGRNADGSVNDAAMREMGYTKTAGGAWAAPGGTEGDGDVISFRINRYDDGNGEMAAFDYRGSASRLNNSLLASLDTFTDISKADRSSIKMILGGSGKTEEKISAIKPYIGKYRQLRDFVKGLGTSLEAPAVKKEDAGAKAEETPQENEVDRILDSFN